MLYRLGNCSSRGVESTHVYSQNLVCEPSLILKNPHLRKSSLTFSKPFQNCKSLGLDWTKVSHFELKYLFLTNIMSRKLARVHGMGGNPPVIPLFSSNMDSWVTTYLSGNPHVVVQKKHYGGPPLRPSALRDYSYFTCFQILLLSTKTYRTFHHHHYSSTTNYNTLKV